MAAVVLEDFYKSFIGKDISEKNTYILMKLTVIVVGIICVALVYVVEKLGAVLQMIMSISAIVLGPSLSLFTMGIFIPWINSKVLKNTSLIVLSLSFLIFLRCRGLS